MIRTMEETKNHKEVNYWKLATIVFAIIIMVIFAIACIHDKSSKESYTFGNFTITKADLDNIASLHYKNSTMVICNLNNNQCIKLYK